MSPITIAKLALEGLASTLEVVEGFLPPGEVKNALAEVDQYVQKALTILNPLVVKEAAEAHA